MQARAFRIAEARFTVTGMVYQECALAVERLLKENPNIISAGVSFATGRARVTYDAGRISQHAIDDVVRSAGYGCRWERPKNDAEVLTIVTRPGSVTRKRRHVSLREDTKTRVRQRKFQELEGTAADEAPRLRVAVITFILFLAIIVTSPASRTVNVLPAVLSSNIGYLHLVLSTIALRYGGWFFAGAAWRALRQRALNTAVLITSALLVAYVYSVAATFIFGGATLYATLTAVLSIALLGRMVEAAARLRITNVVNSVTVSAFPPATVVTGGVLKEKLAVDLTVGDIVLVKTGERVPADGIIVEGKAFIDESPVVGGSDPVARRVGDTVLGMSFNLDGVFALRVAGGGEEAFAARLGKVIENALHTKDRVQHTADIVALSIVPVVALVAALAIFFWRTVYNADLLFVLTIAISTLVIASPATLSLARHLGVVGAIAAAAGKGIVFKDAQAMQDIAEMDSIVFGSPAILLEGKPCISDIVHVGTLTQPGMLRLTAGFLKGLNDYPTQAIVDSVISDIGRSLPAPRGRRVIDGYGAIGRIETRSIIVGNKRMMEKAGIDISAVDVRASEIASGGKTVVYVAFDERIEGVLGVYDDLHPESIETVERLKRSGVDVILFADDEAATAEAIARRLSVETVVADLLPEDKVDRVKSLQQDGRRVGMVCVANDDHRALAQSDVAVVIAGGAKVDESFGLAGLVIPARNPIRLARAFSLCNNVAAKTRLSLAYAVLYNTLAIPLALGIFYPAYGILAPPEAAAAIMSASTLPIFANAMYIKRSSEGILKR